MGRCTGHCCKSFWLPLSPMEILFQNKLAHLGKSKWNQKDMLKVAEMVIYQRPNERGGYRYTCKHWDVSSGNCLNYENRPTMCRDYPYGKECKYKDCTMTKKCEM
jgi:hypothetical protein